MLSLHAASPKPRRYPDLRQAFLVAAITTLVSAAAGAASDEAMVELNAVDGSAIIKGELLEIGDGSYVVKTALGTLRIGLDEAECVGEGCPSLDRFDSDFTIFSENHNMQASMQALLSSYARNLGAVDKISDGDEVTIRDKASGARLATVSLGLKDVGVSLAKANSPENDEDLSGGVLSMVAEQGASTIDEEGLLLALDGVAVIVHPDIPIVNLSRETIANLFACREERIPTLRQTSPPTRLYSREVSSDVFQAFKALVLDPYDAVLCDDALQLPTDDAVAAAVAADATAIGFVKMTHIHDAKPLAVAECSLAVEPLLFNAKSGDYPLARRLLLQSSSLEESSGAVQQFVDFALSEAGQNTLGDGGLVNLNLDTTDTYASRYRLKRIEAAATVAQDVAVIEQLITQTRNAARLSATFRFSTGSSDAGEAYGLDKRAQRDLTRLVSYLKTDVPEGTELLVFGFADASGDYGNNLALSASRAQSVADKLAALGVPISTVAGFGEEAPIACNDDAAGRSKNRRVEIWLRFPERSQVQDAIRVTM